MIAPIPGVGANALAPAEPSRIGPPLATPPDPSFVDALAGAASSAADTLRAAETASIEGMRGEMPTREVVDRVMEAERTLRAAVAVRDKIVSGWLDLSRMQI